MYPLPLNNIKGYSLDVSTESHAVATLDKLRNKNCLLLAIVMGALAALCFLVGRFESHPSLVVPIGKHTFCSLSLSLRLRAFCHWSLNLDFSLLLLLQKPTPRPPQQLNIT